MPVPPTPDGRSTASPGWGWGASSVTVSRSTGLSADVSGPGPELFISAGTVKTHLARVQKKLGVQNRVGIAAWVWESGLMAQASFPGCQALFFALLLELPRYHRRPSLFSRGSLRAGSAPEDPPLMRSRSTRRGSPTTTINHTCT